MLRTGFKGGAKPSNRRKLETHRIRNNSVAGKAKVVLLDSSFLLTMLRRRRGVDYFRTTFSGPIRLVTVDRVIYELQRIARSRSSEAAGLARVALSSLEKLSVPAIETIFGIGEVDTAIVATSLAERDAVTVATTDRGLRDTLRKQGIPTLSPSF